MKGIFKKVVSLMVVTVLMLPLLVRPVQAAEMPLAERYSLTPEELIDRILETYDEAGTIAGRRRFKGKCSTLVNCSTMALGIQTQRYDGDGRDEYDLYENVRRTDLGYDVIRYDAGEYDLEAALNAITENGTRDAYNIIVGFEGGRTATSSKYGHTCFVHGIVDGMVYYSESYDLELAGTYYAEGQPIVCTIGEFAHYYNLWAELEGVIHFDFPDETAPAVAAPEIRVRSTEGFTVSFRADDNMEITALYARVWRQGETESDGVILPVTMYNDAAAVRVNSADFEDYQGTYYVKCYALDRKGNLGESEVRIVTLSPTKLAEGCTGTAEDPVDCGVPCRTLTEPGNSMARYIGKEPTLWEMLREQLHTLL